jgi:hypothetical protein
MDTDKSDKREQLPRPNAFVIIGETVLERLHQVAQRIRENIAKLLSEEEGRQHKSGG